MQAKPWMQPLDDADLTFVKRFILSSGSLKEMAAIYKVSYPTVRIRLDRLIAKIRAWDAYHHVTEFERELRVQFAAGNLSESCFKRLLDHYRKEQGT